MASPLIARSVKRHNWPTDLRFFDPEQLSKLLHILSLRYKSLDGETILKRVEVSEKLSGAGLWWDSPEVLEWIRQQETSFTQLSVEQMDRLAIEVLERY